MGSTTHIHYPESIEQHEQPEHQVAEPITDPAQEELFDGGFPAIVNQYPQLRFMGSKFRLLPWIHKVLCDVDFTTAFDAFSGSGCVAYLFKYSGPRIQDSSLRCTLSWEMRRK